MPSKASSTINLGLPEIPETKDPEMFQEFLRLYNAIKLLSQFTDLYTAEGTVVSQLEDTSAGTSNSVESLTASIRKLTEVLESLPRPEAALSELQKKYFRYTVPSFTVTGAFGTNGKSPQVSYVLGLPARSAPAGGTGTVAGGWDTAANRDTAIAAINANAASINNIQLALLANGIGKIQ